MKHVARAALWLGLALRIAAAAAAVPTPDAVRQAWRASDVDLLDRHGEVVDAVRIDLAARKRPWVVLDDISPALGRAVLQAEDQRFMAHGGIDYGALGKAAWDDLLGGGNGGGARPRGASTVTMQLAGLLDPSLAPRAAGRSLLQKWDQVLAARELEAGWTKRQILEAYLNLASYRGELTGIGAAARGLFGKAPSGLDANEAAILASLLRAPTAAPKVVARRACALAREIDAGADCDAIALDAEVALTRGGFMAAPRGAADAVNGTGAAGLARCLAGVGGGTSGGTSGGTGAGARTRAGADARAGAPRRSSLEAGLQRAVAASLRRHLAELAGRNVGDGAVVVLDNASGEVLAYVANAGNGDVDGATALRQAGSTLKPFLYELALERGQLTAASLLTTRRSTSPPSAACTCRRTMITPTATSPACAPAWPAR